MRRLTEGEANDQLLYFTSSSLTQDDQTLVFISDREGINLHVLDRFSGEVRRLTDNQEGYLRSYVYFDGQPYCGLGLASPCFHAASGDLYYLQGLELRSVNALSGESRTLAALPGDHVTGFTHVSDDNLRVCVPTIRESAFADIHAIDHTVQRLGLASHLRVFDTRSGSQVDDIEVERGWVTHVQFRPGNSEIILLNHEWPADCGIRRMWLYDGSRIRRLRSEGSNAEGTWRRREDWVCHEVWSRDGRHVLYHGTYAGGRSFIGRVSPSGDDPIEIALAPEYKRYGHFSPGGDPRWLVSDAYYGNGEWISLLNVNWEEGRHRWLPLCRHGSSWSSQDAHPHPIFNHADTEVLYTSDIDGKRAIYAVDLGGSVT